MNKQNILAILAIIGLISGFLIFTRAHASTSFTSSIDGNWNSAATWGKTTTFSNPAGIALDSSGNMYIGDFTNRQVVKLGPSGNTLGVFSANGTFSSAVGLTVDSSGNMYVVDQGDQRIVKMSPLGDIIATFNAGDTFSQPTDVVLDSSGNMYVVDADNNRIVKMDPSGNVITTFTAGDSFNVPFFMTLDPSGNMYVVDENNNRIVKMDPSGSVLATFTAGDSLSEPIGIALDASGNMYVSDSGNNRIVKMDPSGTVLTTFTAGNSFSIPVDIALDSSNNMYVTDQSNNRIVKMDPSGAILAIYSSIDDLAGSTFPGSADDVQILDNVITLTENESVQDIQIYNNGTLDLNGHTLTVNGFAAMLPGSTVHLGIGGVLNIAGDFLNYGGTFAGEGGTVNLTGTNQTISGNTTFYNLTKTVSSADTLYIVDGTQTVTNKLSLNGAAGNLLSLKLPPNAPPQQTLAWGHIFPSSQSDRVTDMQDVARDTSENIYISDPNNNRVVKMDSSGNFLTAFTAGGTLQYPSGIAFDSSHNIYVTDFNANDVVKMDPSGNVIATFDAGGALNEPNGLALDASGNIYVANLNTGNIIEMDPSGNVLNTFTGGDTLNAPADIALDSSGNMYVADQNENDIVKMDPSGTVIATFDDGGGFAPPGGPVEGIALDADGNMYATMNSVPDIFQPGVVKMDPSGNVLATFTLNNVFGAPAGITVDSSGNIYTADPNAEGIIKINPSGKLLDIFNGIGSIPNGYFEEPGGIAVDPSGNTYVTDCGEDFSGYRVQKFDSSGNFSSILAAAGTGSGETYCPQGVAADSSGNVYVVDTLNYRIEKFNSSGSFVSAWGWGVTDGADSYEVCTSNCQAGLQGSSAGQFNNPEGVTVSPSGDIYVADNGNDRIEAFDSSGDFIAVIGGIGEGDGQFESPYGVAFDLSGNMYIADTGNNRVEKFDPSGDFVSTWGVGVQDGTDQFQICTSGCRTGLEDGGQIAGELDNPTAIVVDSTGTVFVNSPDNDPDYTKTFTTSGVYLNQFNPFGVSADPTMAIDPEDNIYTVSTQLDSVIQKFSPVSGFSLDPQGSVSLSYLSVSSSTNAAISAITCNACTDGGGNINWQFSGSIVTHSNPPPGDSNNNQNRSTGGNGPIAGSFGRKDLTVGTTTSFGWQDSAISIAQLQQLLGALRQLQNILQQSLSLFHKL